MEMEFRARHGRPATRLKPSTLSKKAAFPGGFACSELCLVLAISHPRAAARTLLLVRPSHHAIERPGREFLPGLTYFEDCKESIYVGAQSKSW
jgi:hypothetical protein